MKITAIFRESTTALTANKGRSFLTILGIIIGIGSVIALMSLGAGVSEDVSTKFSALGTKEITINSQDISEEGEESIDQDQGGSNPLGMGGSSMRQLFRGSQGDPSLTTEDLDDISQIGDSLINNISPEITNLTEVIVGEVARSIQITGVSSSFFDIKDLTIENGDFFTQIQVDNNDKVAVLGSQVKQGYFEEGIGTGEKINIGEVEYEVIGILAETESSRFQNPNQAIYIPYLGAMEDFEMEKISTITVEAVSEDVVQELSGKIENLLLENHNFNNIEESDFSLFSSQDLLQARSEAVGVFANMLIGIAAISLLVGGIGIMNIMLVSVTERTREIGLRKAVGAKTRHILIQFLTESVLLTLTGGIIGVIVGQILGKLATRFVNVNSVFSLSSIFLAVGVSVGVGVIFGLYPALKAARKDPVDAIRYE